MKEENVRIEVGSKLLWKRRSYHENPLGKQVRIFSMNYQLNKRTEK